MNRYFTRIEKLRDNDLTPVAKLICIEYNLGKLENTEIVEIGYEDLNVVISTESGKYLAKIFNIDRTAQEVLGCIQRTDIAGQTIYNVPKIICNRYGEKLTQITLDGLKHNVSLFSFITGHDFFTLQVKPSPQELDKITGIACELSEIKYIPSFVYDKWAIPNFLKEFNVKSKYIPKEYLSLLKSIYNLFCRFNYDSLPKAFVHGDMTSTNVMKDDSGEIWLIDFSVSNYMARLIEIVIICSDLALIEDDCMLSKQRIEHCFNLWCTKTNATAVEGKAFKLFFSIANAINVLNTSYEVYLGNNSRENEWRMKQGLFGLTLY